MNLLFDQKYQYTVFEPVNYVQSKLKSIVKTPWYDIDINLAGKVLDNNTFQLYSKLSMGVKVFGVIQSVAIIKGSLEPKNEQTNIHVDIKPNYLVLGAFYVIALIFLFMLFGLFTSITEYSWVVVAGLLFLLVFIRSLIYFSIGQLKNRFERIMLLHPEE